MKEKNESWAVDFDGTLNLADKYPELGKPNMSLFEFLKKRQQEGDKIILWTCRTGDYLKAAVKYCEKYGMKFDAINSNLKENTDFFGSDSRKVYANHYIDDKNIPLEEWMEGGHEKNGLLETLRKAIEERMESMGRYYMETMGRYYMEAGDMVTIEKMKELNEVLVLIDLLEECEEQKMAKGSRITH